MKLSSSALLSSVIASMVLFTALFAEGALLKALTSVTLYIYFRTTCFMVALVPFLTGQLICATAADELSTIAGITG